MILSKNHFIINLGIGILSLLIGFIANITASIILNDYSYIYGFLLGSISILMWIGFYFFLFKKEFFLKKTDNKKNTIKRDVFILMFTRTLLLVFPFVFAIIIYFFLNKNFNPFSMISINIVFILIVRLINFIYAIKLNKK